MPDEIKLRWPGVTNRIVLAGRTGTGKTVAGLWHLSNQDLERPWVVLNFKNDEHIDSIDNTLDIGFDWKPTKNSRGLHILRPIPSDMKRGPKGEPPALETFLYKIWERENCGLFVDEAFMIGMNEAFDVCLTQGRSKHIPMIICTQRPVWISRFCFSEASFIQVFDLNDKRDIITVEGFVPILWDEERPLGPHESWYYEIDNNQLVRLKPVPNMNKIREVFKNKLHTQWQKI